jgi:hypothetical protein
MPASVFLGAVSISSGVSGLATDMATFLGNATSANLATTMTDETGSGALVFANTPALVTPDIGAATGASVALTGGATVATSIRNLNGTNGQAITDLQTLTELTTIAASPTTTTTIQMPANSVVLGVAVRVTVAIPTATTFTVGDAGSATRFSTAAVSVNVNSTDPGTKAGAYYNATAAGIVITPNGTPANTNGRVRVVIYYYSVTPPTS